MSFYSFKARGSSRVLLGSIALAAAGFGLAGCGDDSITNSNTGPDFHQVRQLKGTVVGTLLDNNGSPVANAIVSIPDGAIGSKSGAYVKASGAKLSTGTNGFGQFSISNVIVTSVSQNAGQNNPPHLPINIFVDTPTGYLDATISVGIQAQQTGDVVAVTNPQVVLIDGFTVDVGTVRIPATGSSIHGILRQELTDAPVVNQTLTLDFRGFLTDNPATGNNSGNCNPGNPSYPGCNLSGAAVTYAVPNIAVGTGADGSFTFANVADDSCYNLAAQGDFIGTTGENATDAWNGCAAFGGAPAPGPGTLLINTLQEGTVFLGNIEVSPHDTGDEEGPFPIFVDGVLHDTGVAALFGDKLAGDLTSTTQNSINIHFSEAFTGGSNTNVRLTRVTGGACASGATEQLIPQAAGSPVISQSAATINVVPASPLVRGAQYCVYINEENMVDAAGNNLRSSPGDGSESDHEPDGIGYDFDSVRDLVITLTTPQVPVTGLAPVTDVTQINDPVNSPDNDPFFRTTTLFLDVVGPTPPEDNLNVQSTEAIIAANELSDAINDQDVDCPNYDGSAAPSAGVVGAGCATGVAAGGPVPYNRDVARIRFTIPPAGANGQPQAVDFAVVVREGGTVIGGTDITGLGGATVANNSITLDAPFGNPAIAADEIKAAPGATTVSFIIRGVMPNDVVQIITRGDVDGNGTADIVDTNARADVTLLDDGTPFTGINLLAKALAAAVCPPGDPSCGNASGGGVVIGSGTPDQGLPILPVTPQVLDKVDVANNGFAGDTLQSGGELEGQSDGDLRDKLNPALPNTVTIADATGTASYFGASSAEIGVVVTEPLAPVADQPAPTPETTPNTTFVAHGVRNHLVDETGTALSERDYYTITIGNILDWQADGQDELRIRFPGLTDENGLPAPTDGPRVPGVEVRDVLPPLMTRGFYDGRLFVFDFDEHIKDNVGTITLTACGVTMNINAALSAPASGPHGTLVNLAGGGSRLTIPQSFAVGFADPVACFPDIKETEYAEDAFYSAAAIKAAGSDLPTAAVDPTPAHGLVDYSDVEDTTNNSDIGLFNGNSWDKWATTGLGLPNVLFAAADVVGPFGDTNNIASCGSAAAPATTFTCQLVLTQPVKLDWGLGACGATPAIPADPNGGDVDLNNDGVITETEVLGYLNGKFAIMSGPADAAPDTVQALATKFTLRDGTGALLNLGFPIDACTAAGHAKLNSGVDLTLQYSAVGIVTAPPATTGAADRFWLQPDTGVGDPLGIYSAFDPTQQLQRDDGGSPLLPGELKPTVLH